MKRLMTMVMAMMMTLNNTTMAPRLEEDIPRVDQTKQESAVVVGKIYPMTTVVDRVENDIVYCVDFNGEEWAFSGEEDWSKGDYCSMLMDDRGTEEITDDKIIDCKYDGWLNGYFGFDGETTVIEYWH